VDTENISKNNVIIKKNKNKISEEQKAGFILVIMTGTLSLVLGILFIFRSVNRPFDINYEGPLFLTSSNRRALEVERMKTQDTDGDGLSDYDEVFTFGTSPYLIDTSGDGISDGDHVRAGNNPLTGSVVGATAPTTEFNDGFFNSFNSALGEGVLMPFQAGQADNPSPDAISDPWQIGAAEIRKILAERGMTEEQLRQVTDQQLLERYYTLLEQFEAGQIDESGNPIVETEETTLPPSTIFQ
jgi:hypothetical protein